MEGDTISIRGPEPGRPSLNPECGVAVAFARINAILPERGFFEHDGWLLATPTD